MTSLTIRSYLLLLSFEWDIVRRNFRKVYKRVQAHAVRPLPRQDVSPELLPRRQCSVRCVFQRGAVFATLGNSRLSSPRLWNARIFGSWCTALAISRARMGRIRRRSRE